MSQAIAKQTYYYIGYRIPLQDQRYIAIAISKKLACVQGLTKADFEDNNDNKAERYKILNDLAACYIGQITANYGVTINMLKRLTANSLKIFS